jgi:hypothetical protein
MTDLTGHGLQWGIREDKETGAVVIHFLSREVDGLVYGHVRDCPAVPGLYEAVVHLPDDDRGVAFLLVGIYVGVDEGKEALAECLDDLLTEEEHEKQDSQRQETLQ